MAPRGGKALAYDVVGPVCETGDTFARDRDLAPLEAEDLVVFTGAGAYGAVMASEYNSRPLIPEVLVDGDQWAVIRRAPPMKRCWIASRSPTGCKESNSARLL